jgi:hypothetical protein
VINLTGNIRRKKKSVNTIVEEMVLTFVNLKKKKRLNGKNDIVAHHTQYSETTKPFSSTVEKSGDADGWKEEVCPTNRVHINSAQQFRRMKKKINKIEVTSYKP